ncbi:hypothetical protein BKA80DRAFT_93507 [Phyllosticta citrichinensis]
MLLFIFVRFLILNVIVDTNQSKHPINNLPTVTTVTLHFIRVSMRCRCSPQLPRVRRGKARRGEAGEHSIFETRRDGRVVHHCVDPSTRVCRGDRLRVCLSVCLSGCLVPLLDRDRTSAHALLPGPRRAAGQHAGIWSDKSDTERGLLFVKEQRD